MCGFIFWTTNDTNICGNHNVWVCSNFWSGKILGITGWEITGPAHQKRSPHPGKDCEEMKCPMGP
ncbi:hypothetical protein BD626DRAFT_629295 [Schizophyllum amplum]|uniref:Uncharacterized protein n=1 Tax=Schizophyllum amplum TaxID=97359 RepID=A0A550CHY6_9AGAR|nr:hypothetical protein BD626DRAFT_629295 [Auriculariopsis ampla]